MTNASIGLGVPTWWKTLVDRLFATMENHGRRSPPLLDPRGLSDHMKRDVGYLDGRGSGKRRR